MKSLIKILFASVLILILSSTSNAQSYVRTRIMAPLTIGNSIVLGQTGTTISNSGSADSLGVSDTVSYIVPIIGPYSYLPFLSYGWTKIGSGTATVTASFYEGNTFNNFNPVKAGVANTSYTKTLTLSASTTGYFDFLADSVKVSGNYLRIVYITSSTASVQGAIATYVKTAIK